MSLRGLPARAAPLALAAALAAPLGGCSRDDVSHARVPKVAAPAPGAAAPPGMPPPGTAGAPGGGVDAPPVPDGASALAWTLPKGWTQAGPSAMRFATLKAPVEGKLDVSVVVLPGPAGGELANVNRWRSQIGLPAVAAAELAGLVSSVSAGPKTLSFVDFTKDDKRVAAAWTRHGENTWFFKFSGPAALVGAEKAKFSAFLESIRFTASGD